MDEREVIDGLVAEITGAKGSWQQASCKQFVFGVFKQSPKNKDGFPALSGDTIRARARERLCKESGEFDDIEYEDFEKALSEMCDVWDEWRYALENWGHS